MHMQVQMYELLADLYRKLVSLQNFRNLSPPSYIFVGDLYAVHRPNHLAFTTEDSHYPDVLLIMWLKQ